jgi:hypothetical protein
VVRELSLFPLLFLIAIVIPIVVVTPIVASASALAPSPQAVLHGAGGCGAGGFHPPYNDTRPVVDVAVRRPVPVTLANPGLPASRSPQICVICVFCVIRLPDLELRLTQTDLSALAYVFLP